MITIVYKLEEIIFMKEKDLSHSMTHYLLTIHKLKEQRGFARVTDIARELSYLFAHLPTSERENNNKYDNILLFSNHFRRIYSEIKLNITIFAGFRRIISATGNEHYFVGIRRVSTDFAGFSSHVGSQRALDMGMLHSMCT